MGMASSQARLLNLTSRMHQIEYKAAKLEAEKLQMANHSRRVNENYLEALEKTKVQYSMLQTDGAVGYVDANLATLSNKAIPNFQGEGSNTPYLLQNISDNKIYVTKAFADAYGITETESKVVPDLNTYLTQEGCAKQPVKNIVTDYQNVLSVNPVNNKELTQPSTITVKDPSTFSLNGNLTAPVETVGQTSYIPAGIFPTVNTIENTKTIITTGTDATTSAINTNQASSVTEIDKTTLTISPNQTYTPLKQQTLQIPQEDLNKTIAELFPNMTNEDVQKTKFLINNSDGESVGGAWYWFVVTNDSTTNTTLKNLLGSIISFYDPDNRKKGFTYNSTEGSLTGTYGTFGFAALDLETNKILPESNDLIKYLNDKIQIEWDNDNTQNLTKDTKVIDYLMSNKSSYVGTKNGRIGYYTPSLKITNNESGTKLDTDLGLSNELTFDEYFKALEQNISGFTYTTDTNGNMSVSIDGDYKLEFYSDIANQVTQHSTTTNNEIVDLNTNAIAENIFLARAITQQMTSEEYNTAHDSSVQTILNQLKTNYKNYSTDEDKRQLAIFSENLSNALKTNDINKIQQALQQLGVYNNSSDKFKSQSKEDVSDTSSVITNRTFNLIENSPVSITPSTQTIPDKGTLNVASDSDMKNFLAYQLWQNDSSKTYNDYLSSINSKSYDSYKLAELIADFDKYKTQLAQGTDLSASLNKYSSENYILNQNSTNSFNVTEKKGIPSVQAASKNDILNALAIDIYKINNTSGNIQSIKSSLQAQFSDKELASLSSYVGTADWANIVNTIAAGTRPNTQFLTKYESYNPVTFNNTDKTSIVEETHSHDESQKGKVAIPLIEQIASNLLVAFRKIGYNLDENEVINLLKNKYNTDNDINNSTLTNINAAVYNYLTTGANTNNVQNIYNHLTNNSTLNIPSSYNFSEYESIRTDLGKCTATYGKKEVETGELEWIKDDKYKEAVKTWNTLKKLEGFSFVIVTDEQANSSEFLSNFLTTNEAILLEFKINEENTAEENFGELRKTRISVECNLQEVADTSLLKKAEAQYEADMLKIDRKDRKYDYDLAALEAERNAIKQEIETLKTVAKENVDRTFKLFS